VLDQLRAVLLRAGLRLPIVPHLLHGVADSHGHVDLSEHAEISFRLHRTDVANVLGQQTAIGLGAVIVGKADHDGGNCKALPAQAASGISNTSESRRFFKAMGHPLSLETTDMPASSIGGFMIRPGRSTGFDGHRLLSPLS